MLEAAKKLVTWYRRHGRDLPWRGIEHPGSPRGSYRIFMSEIMLQQTQVDRVIPKYHAWLKRFPTWRSLTEAKTADLIHAWAGLGYNRRALYARDAARSVLAHGVPTSEAAWRALKGVGPYAAAALAEFSSHTRALVIDTNVRRVIGRIYLGKPFPAARDDGHIRNVLEKITPTRGAHWDLPQAVMDLANAVCLPRTPLCATCPLRTDCKAAKKFLSGKILKKIHKKTSERVHAEKKYPDRIYRGKILAIVRNDGRVDVRTLGMRIDDTFDLTTDADWLRAMIDRLIKDGLLVEKRSGVVALP